MLVNQISDFIWVYCCLSSSFVGYLIRKMFPFSFSNEYCSFGTSFRIEPSGICSFAKECSAVVQQSQTAVVRFTSPALDLLVFDRW